MPKGKLYSDIKKASKIEGAFAPLRLELLHSLAWRTQSINCRRLIDVLIMEHLSHAGTENGNLLAPYNQLQEYGIGRRFIHRTIQEAEKRGLLRVEYGAKWGPINHANIYTITFLPVKEVVDGKTFFTEPPNDWRRFNQKEMALLKEFFLMFKK